MCIRDSSKRFQINRKKRVAVNNRSKYVFSLLPVSYTHLRAHETDSYLVCRLLLEKKGDHRDLHRVDRRQRQMCIRDSSKRFQINRKKRVAVNNRSKYVFSLLPVSYTHLRAHETDSYLVCRLLLEKK